MRTPLLALVLAIISASAVLAQRPLSPPPAASAADGPLLGPPVIDIPEIPNGQTSTPPAGEGEKRKLFRLPSIKSNGQSSAVGGRMLQSRWKQPTGTAATEAQPFSPGGRQVAPSEPETAPPAKKRWFAPQKYGPVTVFPKPKDTDRQGNPLSLRRPMLAW